MKNYVMIGAGGTGTHLLGPLVAYLGTKKESWALTVIDGDSVEDKNLERQLFHPAMVTMNKAEASLLPYKHLENIVAVRDYLGASNIAEFIPDNSTVLICVDNFPIRAMIESHCNTLPNVVVINGGNERESGSCQIWERGGGKNTTPPLSYNHPEILAPGKTRADMTCEETAQLPGGEQLIVTNMASANYMLLGLMDVERKDIRWTEAQFNLGNLKESYAADYRDLKGWN